MIIAYFWSLHPNSTTIYDTKQFPMRKIIFTLLLFLSITSLNAQWSENFDGPGPITLTSSGAPGWSIDTLHVSQPNGYRGQYSTSGTVTATSPLIFANGMNFVTLSFKHICKVEFADTAKLEISVDGGNTWNKIIDRNVDLVNGNAYYLGDGQGNFGNFGPQLHKFTEGSYLAWAPGTTNLPDSSWWRQEIFDISLATGGQDFMVRFTLRDGASNNGMFGRYGWVLDDINIVVSPCETNPPTVNLASGIQGNVYNTGPYNICAYVNDPSTIMFAELYWTVNGGPLQQFNGMGVTNDSLYCGVIPTMNIGDTVCWYIEALDNSGCMNMATYPSVGNCVTFIVNDGISFPFCENFDLPDLWTDSTASGSPWEIGVPTNPLLNSAHSPFNVAGVGLTGDYLDDTESYLTLMPLGFGGASNANLTFWANYDVESGWDGVRLEYDLQDGTGWHILGDENSNANGQAVNWYNDGAIGTTNLPAWTGSSNGWTFIRYKLINNPDILSNPTDVIFRFAFDSDGIINGSGFHFDDFCIKIPCPNDLGMVAFLQPVDGSGQAQGNNSPLVLSMENFGLSLQTGATLSYSVNGGPQIDTTWTGTINPGDVIQVALPDLTIDSGAFTVCAWVTLASGDCDNTNDTICATFTGIPTLTPTYCDDFESGNIGWLSQNGPNGAAGSTWELGLPAFNSTTGAHSGTNAWDINLTTGYGNNAQSYLYTPFFDMSSLVAANLSFWRNNNIDEFGDGLRLEYTPDGGTNWFSVGTGSSTNPDPCGKNWYTNANIFASGLPGWDGSTNGQWVQTSYKLCCAANVLGNPQPVQFRFIFESDFFTTNDGVSIDDFCITSIVGDDAGISSIVSPVNNVPAGTSTPVVVTLENFGSTTLTSVDITYTGGSGGNVTFTWTGTLAPCGSVLVTLPASNFNQGPNTICAYTSLPSDQDNSNDTTCAELFGIPTVTPTFCDDFESGNSGWVGVDESPGGVGAGTLWELGAAVQTTAHSGVNVWDINLNSQYTNQALAVLYSPYFDFSAVSCGSLSFWMDYFSENGWDGTRLEYTNDNGATWNMVGGGSLTNPDPCGTNWYTDDILNSSQLPAWTNNGGGWRNMKYKLSCLAGIFNNPVPIQFRFVYTSDFSVITGHGVAIDDFCVFASQGDDIGISAIVAPSGGAPVGNPAPVQVILENFGSTTITSAVITYTVNNGPPVTFTWTGSLAPCTEILVSLPSFNFVQGVNTIVAYTSYPGDVFLNNDTSTTSAVGQPTFQPTYSTSYFDNFDAGNVGWFSSNGQGSNAQCNWELGPPAFGCTGTALSPPNAWDVNLNTAVTENCFAILHTPYFDLSQPNSQDARLSFWQNRCINAFGDEFYIDFKTNANPTWQRFGTSGSPNTTNWYNNIDFWDNNSGQWIFCEFQNVNAITGNDPFIQFRFVMETGGFSTPDGVSIDDFQIFIPIPLSVTPTQINTSTPGQLIFPGQQITFATPVNNNGTNAVLNHNITLEIDGNIISVDPVTYSVPGLTPGASVIHPFNNTWIASPGAHEVCVWTDSPNGSLDLNQFDDTTCTSILVFDSIPAVAMPYCNSFESGHQWVTLNAFTYNVGSSFQLGAPNENVLNSAHTGVNAWSLYLDSNYVNQDSSALFSALLRIHPNNCYKLSYWQQFKMEFGSDGGVVEYSDDYGVTWNNIDFTGSPNVQTFGPTANYTYVSAIGQPGDMGWTGLRPNWFYTDKVIRPGVNTQLILRWRFASDNTIRDEGWSIDDFCFEDLGSCSPIGIGEFAIGDFGISQNYPNPASDATTIEYMIPEQGHVSVIVTDILGQVVSVLADGKQDAGKYALQVNTSELAAGIYNYTLVYEGRQMSKRMIITR